MSICISAVAKTGRNYFGDALYLRHAGANSRYFKRESGLLFPSPYHGVLAVNDGACMHARGLAAVFDH